MFRIEHCLFTVRDHIPLEQGLRHDSQAPFRAGESSETIFH